MFVHLKLLLGYAGAWSAYILPSPDPGYVWFELILATPRDFETCPNSPMTKESVSTSCALSLSRYHLVQSCTND